jgi:hypothetical protein
MNKKFRVIKIFEEDWFTLNKIKDKYRKIDPDINISYPNLFKRILNGNKSNLNESNINFYNLSSNNIGRKRKDKKRGFDFPI